MPGAFILYRRANGGLPVMSQETPFRLLEAQVDENLDGKSEAVAG